MKSLARQGLDALLAAHPDEDLVNVFVNPVWLGADLATGLDAEGSFLGLAKYAIWRRTGNVYELDEQGAAGDDPVIAITPLG